MEIRNLSTFIKVAEEQSLSKAAKQLGYAQSTVTMQMQQLEQELGISLYERVGKQIRITQEGQELLTYAARILKTSQEALQIGKEKKQEADGSLRIGMADNLGELYQAKLLHIYATKNPKVQLVVRSGESQELIQKLLHNEIDLIVTLDHLITESTLIHAHQRREQVHFVTTPVHPLAGGRKMSIQEVVSHSLFRSSLGKSYERDLETAMLRVGAECRMWTEIENTQVLIQMLLYQNGVAWLPDSLVLPYLQNGTLVKINCEISGAELWQQTLYHKNKWKSGAMNAWIKMLEEQSS